MKRKMNTDLFQLVDYKRNKSGQRSEELQKVFDKFQYLLDEE